MESIRCFAFLVLSPFGQDRGETVGPLLEMLDGVDIVEREKAAAELVKLGPKILPSLRTRLDCLSKEGRSLLEEVIRKLERAARIENLMAPAPSVTFVAKDRRVDEALADFSKQSGVIVESRDLPPGTRVSLSLRNVSIWQAVDDLCRAHGRLMYSFGADRIVIREGVYRKLPVFDQGPFRFVVDAFEWSIVPEVVNFDIQGGVLAPPGRFPDLVQYSLEKFEDASGTPVSCIDGGLAGEGPACGAEIDAPVIFRAFSWFTGDGPPQDSPNLKSLQATILLRFAANRVRLVSLKNPLAPGDRAAHQGAARLRLHDSVREGSRARLRISYERPLKETEKAGRDRNELFSVALYDPAGRRLRGLHEKSVSVETHEEEGFLRCAYSISFLIPNGFNVESLDLEEAADFDTIRIPIRLDGVPLR